MAASYSPRELFVLGTLSRRPTYGHEIIKTVRVSNAHTWVALSEKHVYYVLRKLSREGLVSETEERPGNAPPRKVYAITKRGRSALREMLQSPQLRSASAPTPFDAVVGMLAYTDVLTDAEALEVLKARRELLAARLTEEHPAEAAPIISQLYGGLARALFEKARLQLQTELTWIDGVIQAIERDGWEGQRVPENYLDTEDR